MKKDLFTLYHDIFKSGKNLMKNARWELVKECPGLEGQHFIYLVLGIMVERFHGI